MHINKFSVKNRDENFIEIEFNVTSFELYRSEELRFFLTSIEMRGHFVSNILLEKGEEEVSIKKMKVLGWKEKLSNITYSVVGGIPNTEFHRNQITKLLV